MTALLDLFSGIGGFSLGLERAGFRTVAFCEIDPWCRRVLAKHWPKVPTYEDVRHLDATRLRADGIERVDAICGGFPCQDISTAGKGAGLDGERSGLWREYARLVGDLRPRYVIVENVGALRGRGLAAVLANLAALGYDAEWHAIPAATVGAPHLRDRVWIIAVNTDAYGAAWGRATGDAEPGDGREALCAGKAQPGRLGDALHAHGDDGRSRRARGSDPAAPGQPVAERALQGTVADPDSGELRLEPGRRNGARGAGALQPGGDGTAGFDSDAAGSRCHVAKDTGANRGDARTSARQPAQRRRAAGCLQPERMGAGAEHQTAPEPEPERERRAQLRGLFGSLARSLAAASAPWERTTQPPLRRVDDGSTGRLDRPRLKALGNAVVPLIPELIGRALLERAA